MGMTRKRVDFEHNTTLIGGVETTHGYIPHLSAMYAGYMIQAPVKVTMVAPKSIVGRVKRYPVVRNGHYIHALPCGGECVGSPVA